MKVRYKQTVLGVAWAVLQPLFTMAIFTVIFGRFAKVPSEGLPYPVFVFAGLLPWMFFSTSIGFAGTSLIGQQHLLTKIYFPRLFVPTAVVCAYLVDLVITLSLYAMILAFYGIVPSWHVVFLPLLIAMTLTWTLGLGYVLAALTVLYRDLRYLIPFGDPGPPVSQPGDLPAQPPAGRSTFCPTAIAGSCGSTRCAGSSKASVGRS